jgi:hypothetical protein
MKANTSARNDKLILQMLRDPRYKIQVNGVIKKMNNKGKFERIGWERHGYTAVTYKGATLVAGRVVYAKTNIGTDIFGKQRLAQKSVNRLNGKSLDDSANNLSTVVGLQRKKAKRLSRQQVDKIVALFCEGNSVAKIARRFRRKISRSHLSRIIRRELGVA